MNERRKEGGCQSERSRGHEMKQRRKDVRPSQGAEQSRSGVEVKGKSKKGKKEKKDGTK